MGKDSEITIPNELKGVKVTSFELNLPDYVEKMNISGEWETFSVKGEGLKEIIFDENTYVEYMAVDEYGDCENLKYFYFQKCGKLTSAFYENVYRFSQEDIDLYIGSVDNIEEVKFREALGSRNIVFHVNNNKDLYNKIKEAGYTVYEDQ